MANQLGAIKHIVQLMLENRSFDQMLGFLYTGNANKSAAGDDYDGLTGNESNPDDAGREVKVFKIAPDAKHPYLMPGADPGEASTTRTTSCSRPTIRSRAQSPRTGASSSTSRRRSPPTKPSTTRTRCPTRSRPTSWGCTRRKCCR